MKKSILLILLILITLFLFGWIDDQTPTQPQIDYNAEGLDEYEGKLVEEKHYRNAFSGGNFSISFSENAEKLKGDIPKSVKIYVDLYPKEGEDFLYEYSLEDQTNNTGGCPGNCIIIKDKENGILDESYFEKEYTLTNNITDFEYAFFVLQFKVTSPSDVNYIAKQIYTCWDNDCEASQPEIYRYFPSDFNFSNACIENETEYYKNRCLSNLAPEAVKLEVCNLITDNEEKNSCYSNIGSLTRDINICENTQNVTNPYRDSCFKAVATSKYDERICEKISKQIIKDRCYSEIGSKKGIKEICQKIIEDNDAKSDCYLNVAQENFDFELCDKVENDEKRGRCYGNLEMRNIANWVSKDNPIWKEYTTLTIEELNKKGINGKFSIQGYAIEKYECPPCPKDALCGICMSNNVTFSSGNNTNVEDNKKFTLYVSNPNWFEEQKQYTLYLTVREVNNQQYLFLNGENS